MGVRWRRVGQSLGSAPEAPECRKGRTMTQLRWVILLLIGGGLALDVKAARAQFPYQSPQTSPFNRPAISPYLNLFRPGGSVSNNYFNLVRPQQQFNNDFTRLSYGQAQLGQAIAAGQESQPILPPTGHAVGFGTQWEYFQTQYRAGALAGARGGAGPGGHGGCARQDAAGGPGGEGGQGGRGGSGRR